MTKIILISVVTALVSPRASAQIPSAEEVISRSIDHHDPQGEWPSFAGTLVFQETRPDGSSRHSRVTIDLPGQRFVHDMTTDETHITRIVQQDRCEGFLNGSPDFTEEQAETNSLSCEQIERYRNYYTYLWGLPMKLRDPGTRIEESVRRITFMDSEALAVRVTYDEEVGGDTWYFYFDPDRYNLVGYRFYHDESTNDGEYIVLEGEYELGDMRIPKSRTWYINEDGRLLGTDTLVDNE